MLTFSIKRFGIQEPMFRGVVPYIASIFIAMPDGSRLYKIGVGMTPEQAVKDLAEKTSFILGVKLVDWHGMLRSLAFASYTPVEFTGEDDDLPFDV